jgi:hypothetical protein
MCERARGRTWISFFFLTVFFIQGYSQPIPQYFFGQNAWMPDTIGQASACPHPPCFLNGKLHKQWGNIKNSGAVLIRFGGIAPDRNRPTNHQFIKMIDSIRAKGMEPIIQVPFHKGQYTASQAAAIVQFINITKGKSIKYWIIGNEPDLDYGYTNAAQVASYIKPFASAMKAVDPTILTIGPETAWFNQSIINGLTTPGGPDDITGKDANGRFFIDIISFHFYPFNGSQTRAQTISKLSSAGGLQDNLIYLNNRIVNCNTFHNRSGATALKTAITEANVNYQNSSTDNLYGNGVNSFLGGQFIAEMMAVSMKNKVDFINIWSVIEGNSTALNIGYIDPVSGNRKPAFHHYKMLADNFKGSFISATATNTNVKVFGSKSQQNIQVMIMNQETTSNLNFTLRLNTAAVSGAGPLKMNINAGVPIEFSDNIENQTSTLLTFNLEGALIKKCVYSLSQHALNNLPPSCTDFAIPLPISVDSFNGATDNANVILLWKTPRRRPGTFIIEKSLNGFVFDSIDVVHENGFTEGYGSYESIDRNPATGLNYYRLKSISVEGSEYSKITAVNFQQDYEGFTLFPNPGDGKELFVKITERYDVENVLVQLSDITGRIIKAQTAIYYNGSSVVKVIPDREIPDGVYLIVIKSPLFVYKSKFIVKRP